MHHSCCGDTRNDISFSKQRSYWFCIVCTDDNCLNVGSTLTPGVFSVTRCVNLNMVVLREAPWNFCDVLETNRPQAGIGNRERDREGLNYHVALQSAHVWPIKLNNT